VADNELEAGWSVEPGPRTSQGTLLANYAAVRQPHRSSGLVPTRAGALTLKASCIKCILLPLSSMIVQMLGL
jgi:hypothetical protein